MKKVLVFGTFDIFHKGHEYFLRQAKERGDYLTVVVARDRTVAKIKGKIPKNPERARLKTVRETGLVDEIMLGQLSDPYAILKHIKPDVICLGYDQTAFVDKLPKKLLAFGLGGVKIEKLRAFRPGTYKSSKLR